jgi:hypothetical protein
VIDLARTPSPEVTILETKSAPSKLRADAPEFIPLTGTSKSLLRRSFNEDFESAIKVDISSGALNLKDSKNKYPPWVSHVKNPGQLR